MVAWIFVNSVLFLLPDGTKSFPEPMSTGGHLNLQNHYTDKKNIVQEKRVSTQQKFGHFVQPGCVQWKYDLW